MPVSPTSRATFLVFPVGGLAGVVVGVVIAMWPSAAGASLAVLVLACLGTARIVGTGRASGPGLTLLVMIAGVVALGRPFALSHGFYLADDLLVLGLAFACLRAALRRQFDTPVGLAHLPWGWLAGFWVVGLVAVLRGLAEGADPYFVARDATLTYYSVIVVGLALVFASPGGTRSVERVLIWSGLAAIAFDLVVILLPVVWTGHTLALGQIAVSQAIGLAVVPIVVGSRATEGARAGLGMIALGLLALWMVVDTQSRAVWVAMVMTAVFVVLTAPSAQRARAWRACALVLATVVALTLVAGTGWIHRADSSSLAVKAESKSSNGSWRLAFWQHDLRDAARRPLTGAGYGPAADFHWHQYRYDARRSRDPAEISGPHNSFVNIVYRTGYLGGLIFLGLVLAVVRRAWRAVGAARRRGDGEAAGRLRAVLAFLLFNATIAFFSVSLETPFLAIPFWLSLGLAVAMTSVERERAGQIESVSSAGVSASRNVRIHSSRLSSA